MYESKSFGAITANSKNTVGKHEGNYYGGAIQSIGDLNCYSNAYVQKNMHILGLIYCDKMYSIEDQTIRFNYNLSANSGKENLGSVTNRWNETYSSIIDAVISRTYDMHIKNNLVSGINNEGLPQLTINATDNSVGSHCSVPTDYALLNTVFKIGKTPNAKKNLYINPYNSSSYINADSFYMANFTNSQKIIDVDNYMNVSIKAVNLRLAHNTLEYPSITAINDQYHIGVSTAILNFDPLNMFNPYELNFNFEKSTFITFYNLRGAEINIKYDATIYTLSTKIEFYYDLHANTLIQL